MKTYIVEFMAGSELEPRYTCEFKAKRIHNALRRSLADMRGEGIIGNKDDWCTADWITNNKYYIRIRVK